MRETETLCQIYKGTKRKFTKKGRTPHYSNSRVAVEMWEPVYTNLFEVQFEFPQTGFTYLIHPAFHENIVSLAEGMNDITIKFEENIDNNNKMIVYPTLVAMKDNNIMIPKIIVKLYNRKGDVFHELIYHTCKCTDYDKINFDYSESDIFRNYATFSFGHVERKFV